MTWTHDKPKEEGVFWFKRGEGTPIVVSVWNDADEGQPPSMHVASIGESRYIGLDSLFFHPSDLWSGPISPPEP